VYDALQARLFLYEAGVAWHGYELEILIAPEPAADDLPSILGQDVLHHLAMTHDPTNGVLAFEVRSADLTLPV
jgi:hypothetical protein